jgi:hypothetical protein
VCSIALPRPLTQSTCWGTQPARPCHVQFCLFPFLCVPWVLWTRPRLQSTRLLCHVPGCYRSHFSQQTVSERGKGCPDHHNGVQTIWQGRGSRGRSSGWGWTMASATRRRSGRSHRARQAISYVIAMSYDHIVRNTVSMSYLPDIASVVNTTSKAMSYLPDIGVRRRIRYRR